MKKAKKTRLHVGRDVLRVLAAHELRQVDAGGPFNPNEPSGDSKEVCCA
jgi:hypothetical protein